MISLQYVNLPIVGICFLFLKDRLGNLRKLKSSLKADVQKYNAYMANLESRSNAFSQKSKSITEELEAGGKDKTLLNSNLLYNLFHCPI